MLPSSNDDNEAETAPAPAPLEERLAQFEAYIIQKVQNEIAGAIGTLQQRRESTGPAPSIDTSAESAGSAAALSVATPPSSLLLLHGRRRGPSGQDRIAMEAVKAKCTALELRQTSLEAKVNALVSDFVLTSQANRHDMDRFATQITREWREHSQNAGVAGSVALGEGGKLGGRLVEAIVQEQKESGQRMREFVGVISILQQEMEKDRLVLQENQAQSCMLMERVIERVNVMDEDIAALIDQAASSGGQQETVCAQEDRLAQLEHLIGQLRLQEKTNTHRTENVVDLVENAALHQKNHESAVSQKLLTVSARIEQLANSVAGTQGELSALRRERASEHQHYMMRLWAVRVASAAQLEHKNRATMRARYFHAWRTWQSSQEQARKDQLVLRLFSKQKAQLDLLQRRVDALVSKAGSVK